MHDIRFDIRIVDGVVGGTGWSDRLTKSGLTKEGGVSVVVVLSACVAVSSYISGPARTPPGDSLARRMIVYSPGHLAWPSSQPRYVDAIIGLIDAPVNVIPESPRPLTWWTTFDIARGTPVNYVSP
jgi:hypothetical protein